MTREQKLLAVLVANGTVILALVAALTYSLDWTSLSIFTLLFVLCYPVIWLSWQAWQAWRIPLMQLTTFTQTLKEGDTTLRLNFGHRNDLAALLAGEIRALAHGASVREQQGEQLTRVVGQIVDAWSQPICLFDGRQQLLFSNGAAGSRIQQPLLIGKAAVDLGFGQDNGLFSHPAFAGGWECKTLKFIQDERDYWLFSAVDIADSLNQAEIATQRNLVRVLSHELRNSLTPMASMADTLLSADNLPEPQVRMVLGRIRQRSERLLNFIQQYAQLNHLPAPSPEWFEFAPMLDEARAMLPDDVTVHFAGERQCYGDVGQLSQVLINLFKNAHDAATGPLALSVRLYQANDRQYLEVADNGDGFANLDNVLTPFYTTKSDGAGIGLALCAEIIRQHGGELTPSNPETGGAMIAMAWPMTARR